MAVRSLYQEPEHALEARRIEWPALEFHDVFKIFHSGPVETVALRGVSLKVQVGELVAILGPSGCGKSTLLSLAEYRARDLAVVFQSDNLWPVLSARENVELGLRLMGGEEIGERAQSALASFGLAKRAGNRPAALSGGEQQRVAIAAAAAREAKLLLADEPTGELDAGNEQAVLEALERLRSEHGVTVLVVTHSNVVADAADRVIEMRDGRRVS